MQGPLCAPCLDIFMSRQSFQTNEVIMIQFVLFQSNSIILIVSEFMQISRTFFKFSEVYTKQLFFPEKVFKARMIRSRVPRRLVGLSASGNPWPGRP